MTSRVKNTLLLIDGNSLFHRAYHALPSLSDRSGENANAVFGFSNMLIKAIGEVKPTHIACAFDTQAPTFRHVEFEKYKAQRPAPPPDLYPQLPKVKKVLDAFGIPYFEKEGYEADDVLATLASKCQMSLSTRSSLKASKVKCQIVILSGDRDVLQLVNGNVKVQMPSFTKVTDGKPSSDKVAKGKPGWGVLVGAKEVKEKYGLEPHQMVDYKSLIGDPSDNVPGVSGIGPKTASQLLAEFHTLENLFENTAELGETTRGKLESGKDVALAAKRLVELDRNVDLPFTINDLLFDPDWKRVRKEYEELGFKSIAAKLPGGDNSQSPVDSSWKRKTVNHEHKTDNNSDQLKLV